LVANGMVLMGIASHNDAPCTRGTLIAYDLNTGVEKWRQHTVPERICYDDTTNECSANSDCVAAAAGSPCLIGDCDSNPEISCTTNADCPSTFLTGGQCIAAGSPTGECWLERSISCTADADCPACVPGVGGGVTATPAASADGTSIYMASVGCLSRPSIGNSDSIFKLDAATGDIVWAYRTESIEQFQSFEGGPTYHDYGFLNGPILTDNGTPLAVAGGKDGAIYAVNQETGALEWSNVISAPPTFAGFGLFNGADAYDAETDQFFAALDGSTTYATSNDHLISFNGADGTTGWSELPGSSNASWSSLTLANDVLYAGTNAHSRLDAYNKATGAFIASLNVPSGQVYGGAAVENGVIYIPFGNIISGDGGVIAYQLPTAP
jgi:outer membrane protein assembly factor BamB